MASARFKVEELLTAAHRRLQCQAVAFVSNGRYDVTFCGRPEAKSRGAEQRITNAARWLLLESDKDPEPIVRNRVREVAGGPLAGRFLATAVRADDAQLLGIVICYNEAEDPPFGRHEGRVLQRYSRLFANALLLSSDSLTGLPTRAAFEEQVLAVRDKGATQELGALLYCDIDQLHVVNDLWGFEFGDRAIAHVSRQLTKQLEPYRAVVSRLSGDRFTVFLPGRTLVEGRKIADELRTAVLDARLAAHDESLSLTMSLGVAQLKAGENGLSHGLAAAEIACKAAKDRGRNRVEVYQDADESIIRRHDDILMVRQLRDALDAGSIQIYGQPIARLLQQDDANRYEMLVRIVDDKDKLLMPGSFMSAATRYQLLPQLDRCVISHVLGKLSVAAQQPRYRPLHVSLNLSGPTISQEDFLEWLINELEGSGIAGEWVSFEFTETAAIENLPRAQNLIEVMSARGCSFALDDFGTGLSSLALLNSLKVSTLKIDGSFIRDLLVNKRSESLVKAIAQLANSMGMEVVAEYVETPEICMRLIELQVEYGQGYAIGRPRQLEKILDLHGAMRQVS